MKIKFTSIITNPQNENNKIEFEAPVVISEENGMRVFEFVEPSQKIQNRIEVSNNHVFIFAGPATIEMKLQEELSTPYETPHGILYFISIMDNIQIKEEFVQFEYKLFSIKKELIGKYQITLEIY